MNLQVYSDTASDGRGSPLLNEAIIPPKGNILCV